MRKKESQHENILWALMQVATNILHPQGLLSLFAQR